MDEAEKIFNQTSYERKRTARGAYAKKGGSKSKRCTLPSDSLTPSQKNALNGETCVYKLGEPMDWDTFKSMPADMQYDYLKLLRDKYEGRDKDISEMFDITPRCYSMYKSKHFSTLKGKRGGAPNKTISPKWTEFLKAASSEEDIARDEVVEDCMEEETVHVYELPEIPKLPDEPTPASVPAFPIGLLTRANFGTACTKAELFGLLDRLLKDEAIYGFDISFVKEGR